MQMETCKSLGALEGVSVCPVEQSLLGAGLKASPAGQAQKQ